MIKPKIIAIDHIALGERVRPIDPVWVEALAGEIKASGARQPQLKDLIEVRPVKRNGVSHEIVTGAHRLLACKHLGWSQIEAHELNINSAEALLREIDDHLKRKALTALAMGRALSEMKRVYLEWYPETRNGAHGGRGGKKNEMCNLPFSKKMSDALALDRCTVDRYIAVFKSILPDVAEAIEVARHPIADNRSELARLGMVAPKTHQAEVIALILNPSHSAQTVAEALAWLNKRPVARKTPEDRLLGWWDKADQNARRGFLEYLIMDGALADYGLGPEVLNEHGHG